MQVFLNHYEIPNKKYCPIVHSRGGEIKGRMCDFARLAL